jgi:penicillin-insensitive murein DD-endopeptidase
MHVPKPVRIAAFAVALATLALASLASPASAAPHHGHHRHGDSGRADALAPGAHPARAKIAPEAGRSLRAGSPHKHAIAPVEKAESIGSPNGGRLEGGLHLDTSRPYLRVVPAYESGDVRWGLPVFVNAIDRAAKGVAKRFPGSVLDVGDISKKGGGDLLRHHSHESGRDADLGFYAVDVKGKQVHAHMFLKFDGDLRSVNVPGARFDLPRTWLLVQELLLDPTIRVSHVFIAQPLRKQMLAYARPRVSLALYDRAAVVMMQPTHSLPHDDHLHVRISCPNGSRSCIELARVPPHGGTRVAHRGKPQDHVLRTPSKTLHAAGGPAGAKPAGGSPPPNLHVSPGLSGAAAQEPLEVDRNEAPVDDADVKDEVDDDGMPRITD